ncbi:MAG: Maf family protein [Polymorphobacter sp.]
MILASQSAARRTMLAAAGVAFEAMSPNVDEEAIREAFLVRGAPPRDIADALAETKAVKLSRRFPQRLVLGADQLLVTAEGTILDKPGSRDRAADQLRALMGKPHQLISAAVIVQGGEAVWRQIDTARLTMRPLSDTFIQSYLDAEAEHVIHCVGAYRIEALGAQLFTRVAGDHFTIRGLPLLAVLDFLRRRGVLAI